MSSFLANKRILLGVTGSIAAYKSADLVRRLREAEAHVRVAMSTNAERFISSLTMQAVSGNPVHNNLFDLHTEAAMGHIELARWADLVLIAPATADFMANLARGCAGDLLTTLCLATKAPIAFAPAMNQGMWQHNLTQTNLQVLIDKGIYFLGTGEGSQACGDTGPGRMLEPNQIVLKVSEIFATGCLSGLNVLITAGPTHEAIDPIRFISNKSSGKMGYALAQAAIESGAKVTLITGPVHLKAPQKSCLVSVANAEEMYLAVMQVISHQNIFISAAAVSDYRVKQIADQKLHKDKEVETLVLERTKDILSEITQLSKTPYLVGFAAETEHVEESAQRKLREKKLNMIIANDVSDNRGMGSDENQVIVLTQNHQRKLFPLMEKNKLARFLIDYIARDYEQQLSTTS